MLQSPLRDVVQLAATRQDRSLVCKHVKLVHGPESERWLVKYMNIHLVVTSVTDARQTGMLGASPVSTQPHLLTRPSLA